MTDFYDDTRYVVVWNNGTQSETFTGEDAEYQAMMRQGALLTAGYCSQCYRKRWIETNEPWGWRGSLDTSLELVPATAPTDVLRMKSDMPNMLLFDKGTVVEDADRQLGKVTCVYPNECDLEVEWESGRKSIINAEKVRVVKTEKID
jgi:hypothetical protein